MEKFTYNDEVYYYSNRKFYDSSFMALDLSLSTKVANAYFSNKDFKKMDKVQLLEYIKSTKEMRLFFKSMEAMYWGIDKFEREIVFIQTVIPILTSLYRMQNNPQKALDEANKFLSIYKCDSIALYTSMAAAYCDLKEFDQAKKYADIAYVKQGGGQGYTNELSLVYNRIKKNME